MAYFSFIWKGGTSLACELVMPFRKVSLSFHMRPLWEPSSLTLWRDDGSGIRISARTHAVAERLEVGVLAFELVNEYAPGERVVVLLDGFDVPITVTKLLKDEAGSILESGVILKAALYSEIIVVAGVSPCSIAVQGVLDGLPHIFDTEYPLDTYCIAPMACPKRALAGSAPC
ncbi:MAG: hypothetical protein FWD67_08840 [Betaproteobacteria bacterium]|nr:hypothetical protein [Betaproteobacteria bacterium]